MVKSSVMKETTKILSKLARESGKDFRDAFSDMLDFFIETFDVDNLMAHRFDMASVMREARSKNTGFYTCLTEWAVTVDKEIAGGRVHDFFGSVYEEEVKSAYKAAKMGQYYTPSALCDVCADVTVGDDSRTVSDPACGSGRMLLSAFRKMDKSRFAYFVGEDLDSTSVKMCALNMMMHGMLGHVVCHDTLRQDFLFAYAVNETRWPMPSTIPSVRLITEAECRNLSAWLSRRYGHGKPVEQPQETRPTRKEPFQLTLFTD